MDRWKSSHLACGQVKWLNGLGEQSGALPHSSPVMREAQTQLCTRKDAQGGDSPEAQSPENAQMKSLLTKWDVTQKGKGISYR